MRRTRRKYTGRRLGHESRQSQSVGSEAGVTCHTDKGRQRRLLIRHISRGQHQQKPGVCYLCGQVGHWKADCPTNKRNFQLNKTESSKTEAFISHDTFKTRSKITSLFSIERPDAGAKREVGLLSICFTVKALDKVEILPDHGNNGEPEPSPYNRLKGAAHEWRKVDTSSYILSVIED